MHCSANIGEGGDTALFFGLSGTGKTTLSADPDRRLIGDDEHGWSDDGVFNFEGGCYAKTIRLSPTGEPEIYQATRMFGTILENVILDERTREIDYDDGSITENTRASYPLHFIDNAVPSGRGGHPENVVFLTADAFGVLPPIARLSPEQAMYHFLSGYTAKVAGTERGVTEPRAAFSACFGAPFLPQHATVYADLLGGKLRTHRFPGVAGEYRVDGGTVRGRQPHEAGAHSCHGDGCAERRPRLRADDGGSGLRPARAHAGAGSARGGTAASRHLGRRKRLRCRRRRTG